MVLDAKRLAGMRTMPCSAFLSLRFRLLLHHLVDVDA